MRTNIVRGLTALIAVALVSTPAMASQPDASANAAVAPASLAANPSTSTRKIALGVSMDPARTNPDAYTQFKADTGRTPAVWTIWANWADGSSAFPGAQVDQLHADHTVPIIWWLPAGTNMAPDHTKPLEESCGTDYKKIINGHWDEYIQDWAHQAQNRGTILIRFAQEMDGKGAFPYGTSRCKNSDARFVIMWKHVVSIFRTVAPNVKFVWSPLRANKARKTLYPGSAWVDYVGFTAFNWASSHDREWLTLAEQVQVATEGLASYAGDKPWIVAETGTIEQAGHSRPSWLTKGYTKVYSSFPKVKIIMYFNVDMRDRAPNQPNWMLNTPADISAYRSLAANTNFQGVIK